MKRRDEKRKERTKKVGKYLRQTEWEEGEVEKEVRGRGTGKGKDGVLPKDNPHFKGTSPLNDNKWIPT